MRKTIQAALAATAMAAAGCATTEDSTAAESGQPQLQAAKAEPAATTINNSYYVELHKEGRIYVLSDPKEYEIFRQTHEIPLVVTRVGAGPNRETVKLGLLKAEAKAMEKTVGYKGSAQQMFEGELKGAEAGFYGEIHKEGRIYVFNEWKDLEDFKLTGEAAYGITQVGVGPNRETVVFVQNSKSAKAPPADTMARFRTMYAMN